MKYRREYLALSLSAASALLAVPAFAQTGNLLANGRFDLADGILGWQVTSPQYSSLVFDPNADANTCTGSGSGWATADPSVDFGTATYFVCINSVVIGAPYWVSGEVLFPSAAVSGRANLTLDFMTGTNCSGAFDGGLFAGYALSSVAGWQRLAAGPAVPGAAIQSLWMWVFLTQIIGAEPALDVRFDDIRLGMSDLVFGDDLELGESCRWSVTVP